MDDTATDRTILLVEDDPALALGLKDTLEFEGFRVHHAESGEAGLSLLEHNACDCMILDLMLPGINGYEVCKAIRARGIELPIIMLTARGQEADKIRGLDSGADDYVTKPFSVGELVARVRAVLRRNQRHSVTSTLLTIGAVTVDLGTQTVHRDGSSMPLSFYEVELLKLLHERLGEPVSRDEILDRVWGQKANPTNRTVDNFVVKLRRKLEPDHDRPKHILTVYGHGYKLVL
ncbi:MAG: response regulator transcription factor [Myxococcales bacterium]|nr:response regulator transcription factor [Myxococcales bacterium]